MTATGQKRLAEYRRSRRPVAPLPVIRACPIWRAVAGGAAPMRTRPWGLRTGSRPLKAYLAAVLAWTVAAAVVFLPLGGPGVQPARAASGVEGEGPKRFDPATGQDGAPGRVTVSQANDLRNQVVHVSWTGLTPTVDFMNQPVQVISPFAGGVYYAIRIYQCKGENPRIIDCYGSTLYGGDENKGFLQDTPKAGTSPEFPSNMVIAATRPDGTGEADIELWTATQSQGLGCD